MFKFNKRYFIGAMLLLAAEIVIALFFHDQVIRPYFGDYLVVILIYCFIKSFLDLPVCQTALAVLLFSYGIETLQYFRFVDRIAWVIRPLQTFLSEIHLDGWTLLLILPVLAQFGLQKS